MQYRLLVHFLQVIRKASVSTLRLNAFSFAQIQLILLLYRQHLLQRRSLFMLVHRAEDLLPFLNLISLEVATVNSQTLPIPKLLHRQQAQLEHLA